MSNRVFEREAKAYEALQRVIVEAQAAKLLFERAGLPVPAPLERLFGETKPPRSWVHLSASLPSIAEPPRPPDAVEGSLWVPFKDLMPITYAKGILRREGKRITPKALVDEIKTALPNVSTGGIYNVGPRLQGQGVIDRNTDGWALTDESQAPLLYRENAWGLPEVFQKQELAAHRRLMILHLLNVSSGGLQVMQLVQQLGAFPQCLAPVTKDLLKADLEAMQIERRAKRVSNSKKWVAISEP